MQSVEITGYTTFTFYKRFTSVLQFVLLRAWTVALNALPYNVSIILKDNFHVDKARAKPTTSERFGGWILPYKVYQPGKSRLRTAWSKFRC